MLMLANAIERGDEDDITKGIEFPIATELMQWKDPQYAYSDVRSEYFESSGIIYQLKEYLAKHPNSKLVPLLEDKLAQSQDDEEK